MFVRLSLMLCLLAPSLTTEAGIKDWFKKVKSERNEQQLTTEEQQGGIKQTLSIGISRAIEILAQEGGFLNDDLVRIPLPESMETIASGLDKLGQQEKVDQFVETMNQAAEAAVEGTLPIFKEAISQMSVEDAMRIIRGDNNAATEYFRNSSESQLSEIILPLISEATEQSGATAAYKKLVSKAGILNRFMSKETLDLDQYVTAKTIDGLFVKLAEQEALIRDDPLARTTNLLKKIFSR